MVCSRMMMPVMGLLWWRAVNLGRISPSRNRSSLQPPVSPGHSRLMSVWGTRGQVCRLTWWTCRRVEVMDILCTSNDKNRDPDAHHFCIFNWERHWSHALVVGVALWCSSQKAWSRRDWTQSTQLPLAGRSKGPLEFPRREDSSCTPI